MKVYLKIYNIGCFRSPQWTWNRTSFGATFRDIPTASQSKEAWFLTQAESVFINLRKSTKREAESGVLFFKEQRRMISKDHSDLNIVKQSKLLQLYRWGFSYQLNGKSELMWNSCDLCTNITLPLFQRGQTHTHLAHYGLPRCTKSA